MKLKTISTIIFVISLILSIIFQIATEIREYQFTEVILFAIVVFSAIFAFIDEEE